MLPRFHHSDIYAECMPRLRSWRAKPMGALTHNAQADGMQPHETLLAKLVDGPLSGSTRTVNAVEGRPPKTIDVEFGDRRVRYCLAEWTQSGHSAVYGFLYEV
jgi:hypothetical protein